MRIAAKAPVASCWLVATAAPEEEVEAAEAVAEDEELPAPAVPEGEPELNEVMVEEAADEVPLTRTAVAFLVPHFSSSMQVCWPSASLGWSLMHWLKVAWQMKKGRVCW